MTYLLAGGRRVRAHPAADVFPLLSKDEITALAADIRTYGQRLSVLLQQADDGVDLVLDGRNRLLACEEGGLEPRVECVRADGGRGAGHRVDEPGPAAPGGIPAGDVGGSTGEPAGETGANCIN